MAAATAVSSPPPSTKLSDPTTRAQPAVPSYPLTPTDLLGLAEYSTTAYGQVSLRACVARPRGAHLCLITQHTPASTATWSSVQTDRARHVELNSALVYVNHSCRPRVEFVVRAPYAQGAYPDGIAGELRVARDRELDVGDELTFFYPSTEWASGRPFRCECRAKECIGWFRGAKDLPRKTLDMYFVNKHIDEMVVERDWA